MIIKMFPIHRVFAPALLTLTLSACSGSSDLEDLVSDTETVDIGSPDVVDPDADLSAAAIVFETCNAANGGVVASIEDAPIFAFASTVAPDFSAGQYERISLSETPTLSGCTTPDLSDIFIVTDGDFAYGLGRFLQDSVTQFDIESLEANYQFSVIGTDAVSANPHDIVFQNDTTAYVARYDTALVFIINPSATTEEEFITGSIDLSVYDADGSTQMTAMDIVGDTLFVLMQRLDSGFAPTVASYVAAFDISGETPVEIPTGMGADGLDGIELPVTNVQEMFFNEATNDLIITAAGDAFDLAGSPITADRLEGGVVAVDATDFSVEVLVDDNVVNPEPAEGEELVPEFFDTATIASADKGYIVSFSAFQTSFLRSFNPSTGVVNPEPLAAFNGVNITTLNVAPDGNVWVGVGDTAGPGFDVLNPEDDTLVGERIRTELNPNAVVFINR